MTSGPVAASVHGNVSGTADFLRISDPSKTSHGAAGSDGKYSSVSEVFLVPGSGSGLLLETG